MNKEENIIIIGAGLCGSLLAIRLGQRGYKVKVYEKRQDLRTAKFDGGRSINLSLSYRGYKGLKLVGIEKKVDNISIAMKGRMVHAKSGESFLSPYSGRENEYLYSVSRQDLTSLLLNEAESLTNVTIEFNSKCTHVDFENAIASFYNYRTKEEFTTNSDIIIGTDGVGSALRRSYYLNKNFLFSFSQNYLTHGYKELCFLPDESGNYRAEKNALHVWPRGDFMLIALPNLNGSFTVTLFLSYNEGKYNFNNLLTPENVTEFFQNEFSDALDLMPNLISDFFKNEVSPLGTIKCSPWHYKGKTLLMGDAAHAIVPFYGQGMNASFEDVVEFDEILDQNLNDWETIFRTFEIRRKKHTDAIANLAMDNFYEIRDHLNSSIFKEKRKLEILLEENFPKEYFSKYSLVTFNKKVGFQEAMLIGRAQDKAIINLIAEKEISSENRNLREVLKKIKSQTIKFLNEDYVAKTFEY